MDFYIVDDDYVAYLKRFESRVEDNKNETRPYIGVVLQMDGISFYAPLKSPKPKHIQMRNSVDFHKIDNGKLGAINLNNMIPVPPGKIHLYRINEEPDQKYKLLLQRQYRVLQREWNSVSSSAEKLYKILTTDAAMLSVGDARIKAHCCNLVLLIEKMKAYKPAETELEESIIDLVDSPYSAGNSEE